MKKETSIQNRRKNRSVIGDEKEEEVKGNRGEAKLDGIEDTDMTSDIP